MTQQARCATWEDGKRIQGGCRRDRPGPESQGHSCANHVTSERSEQGWGWPQDSSVHRPLDLFGGGVVKCGK